MAQSIRKHALRTMSAALTAGVATFAAAMAITMSGPAFAADASQDYRFEVVQVVSAGPRMSDVTVRLVRVTDGALVSNADLSANAATAMNAERAGYRQFRVQTTTADPQTLQVSAKVPGTTRIERTFNSSIKAMLTRTVRGEDKVVAGTVVFDAR
jgi:hypothetical protein